MTTDTATPSGVRLLNDRDVRAKIGNVSRSTRHRLQQHEGFPYPVRISGNRVAWRETDVDLWITSRRSVLEK